jgi:beta-glucanase (GH16 family)
MQMRGIILLGSALCAIGAGSLVLQQSSAQSESIGPALDITKFELVFADEFDTMDITSSGPGSKWIAHTPWNGDFGDATFTDPGPNGPFKVKDGKLLIEASKQSDGKWQSGLIASVDKEGRGFKQRYGYFEIRAKLPPGKGLWSAFWLNAAQPAGSKETGLEIDVLEHYGHYPIGYSAGFHVWPKPEKDDPGGGGTVIDVPSGYLYSDFRTYGVDVSEEWITIYLGRVPKWRWRTPPEHRTDMMILANLAMGPGWPIDETPNPSVMEIDYIRAYKGKP